METVTISAEIKVSDIPLLKELLKKFKAKSIKVEEKDPTKMSKEEFKEMLDNAEKEKSNVTINSKEELSNLFKSVG